MYDHFAEFYVGEARRLDGDRIGKALRERGVVTFSGVPDRSDVLRLATMVMEVWRHRDSEPDGVTVISDQGDIGRVTGHAGFGNTELQLHTDSAGVERPPGLILLTCAAPATRGGDVCLVDGARVYQHLADHEPAVLRDLMAQRSVLFGGAAGYLGSIFERAATGNALVRLRTDDLARFSPQIVHSLPKLKQVMTELMITFRLSPGQGYLLANTRWLHGRTEFEGPRLMYRVLGHALPALEVPLGFPAGQPGATPYAHHDGRAT